jgi:hypothetical protein
MGDAAAVARDESKPVAAATHAGPGEGGAKPGSV